MDNALILHGTVVLVFAALVVFVRARQARRELDEAMATENDVPMASGPNSRELDRTTEELESMKDPS